jgi:hypothetical protein
VLDTSRRKMSTFANSPLSSFPKESPFAHTDYSGYKATLMLCSISDNSETHTFWPTVLSLSCNLRQLRIYKSYSRPMQEAPQGGTSSSIIDSKVGFFLVPCERTAGQIGAPLSMISGASAAPGAPQVPTAQTHT